MSLTRVWIATLVAVCSSMELGAQGPSPAITASPSRPAAQPSQTDPLAANAQRSVDGRVRRPTKTGADSTGMGPAVGTWVTLHRVGQDSAGPIDSMRTDGSGRYRFQWRPFGASDAVYFASVTWDGIAYFTAPLRSAQSRGDEAEITVFDTTMRAFPLAVKGRHLIIGAADSTDSRTIIEVFELSNDSLQTLVSPEGASPSATWGIGIPKAAKDVRVTEGEISPDAFAYVSGRVSIFAPIAPGLKQIAFSYTLPAASFPISYTTEHGAVVFEILLEEPQGTVRGEGFTAVEPVTLENRNFRRFLAQDVEDGNNVIVELPVTRTAGRNMYIAGLLVAIGFLMLLVLSRAMQRRSIRASASIGAPSSLRVREVTKVPDAPVHERLAQEIAALDAIYAKQELPSESVQAAYHERRSELKEALADALATTRAAR